jgi:hypothetical protein
VEVVRGKAGGTAGERLEHLVGVLFGHFIALLVGVVDEDLLAVWRRVTGISTTFAHKTKRRAKSEGEKEAISRTGLLDLVLGGAPAEVRQAEKLVGVLGQRVGRGGTDGLAASALRLALLLGTGASRVVDLRLLLGHRLTAEQALQHGLEVRASGLDPQLFDRLLEWEAWRCGGKKIS